MRRRRMLWPRLQSRFRHNKQNKTSSSKFDDAGLMMPAETAPHDVLLFAQAGAVLDATFRMTLAGAPERSECNARSPGNSLQNSNFSKAILIVDDSFLGLGGGGGSKKFDRQRQWGTS